MNFSGSKPYPVPSFGGLVDWDDATKFPDGVGVVVKNCRFKMESVGTRYGIEETMQDGASRVTGLAVLKFINQNQSIIPLRFDYAGVLKRESPQGSGTLDPVSSTLVTPPVSAYMQTAIAYNKAWLAWSDLLNGLEYPSVFNGQTLNLDPISSRTFGQAFEVNAKYVVGEVVCPTVANGHTYRVTVAGTTGAEPVWNTGAGTTTTSGGVTFTEDTPSAASSGTAGNICTGNRYFVVLFKNRNGYYSGFNFDAVQSINVVAANQQITLSNIPLGPENTIARVIAFTVAGDIKTGRYFYIPEDDNTGVQISKTVIADNVTTTATFNFSDDYLKSLSDTDVSDFYLKMRVPPCVDAYYSESMDAMMYSGAVGYESSALISPRQDPETLYGGKSALPIAENNNQRLVCIRETKNGEILAFKENSVFYMQPNAGDPATWGVFPKWKDAGAVGPRAVDIGAEFVIFVHRTGVWRYDGSNFERITDEISTTWQTINWQYKHLIWVHIDEVLKEVRIGVPMGNSTVPNKVLTCNYLMGWEQQIVVNMFGKYIASKHPRKWSVDDIAAHQAITAERTLTVSVDPEIDNQQILLASALADGNVNMIVPGQYNDNGNGIDWQYKPSYAQEESGAVLQFRGVNGTAIGSGTLLLAPSTDSKNDAYEDRAEIMNADGTNTHFTDGVRGLNEYFSYLFKNGAVKDAWAELHKVVLYARPKLMSRPG